MGEFGSGLGFFSTAGAGVSSADVQRTAKNAAPARIRIATTMKKGEFINCLSKMREPACPLHICVYNTGKFPVKQLSLHGAGRESYSAVPVRHAGGPDQRKRDRGQRCFHPATFSNAH